METRKPKPETTLAEINGTVTIATTKKRREIVITSDHNPEEKKAIPSTTAPGSRWRRATMWTRGMS